MNKKERVSELVNSAFLFDLTAKSVFSVIEARWTTFL